ncbi:CoA transferase [Mesorhizobium sp. IMUNJ 23232]|uniref:CoA transferase n=1 Tax=Mesorhizobium sp. IMUNJ 23232 TaxID=3376064 RepID=UPI0037A934DC
MYRFLKGMRIVEAASFIAAPSCGLHLLQLGAEVVRIDQIGGGPDFFRWPRTAGASLYWEGLNKGKKSIAVDLGSPQGRELVTGLITAPGRDRGLFLTNFPAAGFLSYERLKARREDLIVLRVMGRPDGTPAVDYTINSAIGIPQMTGPASLGDEPVNHVLPAWDLLAGAYGAFTLLAAERHRRDTGQGQEIRVPLSDVAMASLGHLGQIAETALSGADRPRHGNDLFGAFGRDFSTRDGKRIMIVAITRRQWSGLIEVLGIGEAVGRAEQAAGVSFARDEGVRFEHRETLNPLVAAAIAGRDCGELAAALDAAGACWGPYRTLSQALSDDPDLSEKNPVFATVKHPSGSAYLTPGAAASFSGMERDVPGRSPMLGEHTDEVLADLLGLSEAEIGALHDRKIVAGPGKQA